MFTGVQSGMPGFVHGGWIAQFFDEIMGRANLFTGGVFVTARLTVKYRRPTPVGVEVMARATRQHVDGRRVEVHATISVDGTVTAESDALFVSLTDDDFGRFAEDPTWLDWSARRYQPPAVDHDRASASGVVRRAASESEER
jgi:acyl-CoA thioesterase FadM